MLPLQKKEKYASIRNKRKQKSKIKTKLVCTFFVATCLITAILSLLSSHTNIDPSQSQTYSQSRQLLSSNEAKERSGYPPDVLDEKQRMNGGWLLYFLGMSYTFIGIALVCDEWFVPAIEVIVERIDMTPDAAGATFMAAGGSAPELFTSLIGTFISRSNVGFGTIVGSAVFNVLFVIGCCAIFTPGHLPLTVWPFARDCVYYILALSVLALFYGVISPDVIEWYEAVCLLLLYVGYATLMFNNQRIHRYISEKILKQDMPVMDGDADANASKEIEMGTNGNTNNLATPVSGMGRTSIIGGTVYSTGVHFHASLYDFLTKDSTVKDLMGIHIVSRMKGEAKDTFDSLDIDGNGYIDREELKAVLYKLGEIVTDTDVTLCFDEIDSDQNGQITFQEFEHWYLASKLRMTTDVKRIFTQFDGNGDGHIDCEELRTLLEAMNEDVNHDINDEDVRTAMTELGKDSASLEQKISETEFVEWYASTVYFEQKQLKRQATLKEVEEEEANGIEIEFPETTFARVMFVVTAPIMYTLYYTLPDVQKTEKKHLWPFTFVGSMAWLMFYSYLMVWWATRIGHAWHVPDEVMGLTFLAAGTSVPDLLSSVIVAKMGEGDMAVSSSIGSNIFDILIGLPLPWLLFCLTISDNYAIEVYSSSLFWSVVILIIMLFLVLTVIKLNKWRLTHKLGYTMFVLWILFVAQDLIRQFCKACNGGE